MAVYQHDALVRVRYAETDQMGYVYYGNYATYLEVGRVEALRELGFPYKELELQGVMLPVREMQVRFHSPARYDDELTVRAIISEMPAVSILFHYEIYNASKQLVVTASTQLVFIDAASGRPRHAPDELLDRLKKDLGR